MRFPPQMAVVAAQIVLIVVLAAACGGSDGSADVATVGPRDVPGMGDTGGGADDAAGADAPRTRDQATGSDVEPETPGESDVARDVPPDLRPDVPPTPCSTDAAAEDCAFLEDGNPCTTPRCEDGVCVLVPDDRFCDDGDPCTVGETCQEGGCVPAGPRDCDDEDPCTVDRCVPGEGCTHDPDPACAACECVADADCDDQEPCTHDWCHVVAPLPCVSTCVREPRGAAADSPACVARACGDDPHCDDGNPCTRDRCLQADAEGFPLPHTARACVYEILEDCAPPAGLACLAPDDCDPAACEPDSPDALCRAPTGSCPTAWCDPVAGCRFVPTEACPFAPECTPFSALADCWDDDLCTGDHCDATSLRCYNSRLPPQESLFPECLGCHVDEDCPPAPTALNGQCARVSCVALAEPNPLDSPLPGYCVGRIDDPLAAPTCEDFDLCTRDSCRPDGGCAHEPIREDCRICSLNIDCDDLDPCTEDRCLFPGNQCENVPIPDCVRCASTADCPADGPCAIRNCELGRCRPILWPPTPAQGPSCREAVCETAADCDDGDAATLEFCADDLEACVHVLDSSAPGYVCAQDRDCYASDPCTRAYCVARRCQPTPVPGCVPQPCESRDDCEDQRGCTLDLCLDGLCFHPRASGSCCDSPADCAGPWHQGPCATPHCGEGGLCQPIAVGTVARCGDECGSDADCRRSCDPATGLCSSFCLPDASCFDWPCAEGYCGPGGRCVWFDGDCSACGGDVDCMDGDPCTADSCDGGRCAHAPLAGCEPVPCGSDAPCDSGDPCVVGLCLSTGCVWFPNPYCAP